MKFFIILALAAIAGAEPLSEAERLRKLNEMLAPDAVPSEADLRWRAEIDNRIAEGEQRRAEERPKRLAEQWAMIERSRHFPDEQAITELSKMVRMIGERLGEYPEEERQIFTKRKPPCYQSPAMRSIIGIES